MACAVSRALGSGTGDSVSLAIDHLFVIRDWSSYFVVADIPGLERAVSFRPHTTRPKTLCKAVHVPSSLFKPNRIVLHGQRSSGWLLFSALANQHWHG